MRKPAAKRIRAIFVSLFLFLLIAQTAYAITIVVDGTMEADWSGVPGQIPGTSTDPNEVNIDDGSDIEELMWTNNPTTLYLGFQTYTNTIWSSFLGTRIDFCLNTDNDTGTGFAYPNCNGMSGIDRFIRITPGSGSNLNVVVFDETATPITTATVSGMYNGTFSEVSVDLASMEMDSASACSGTMLGVVYFDGGTTNPDDNTPNSGTMTFTCGSPSAVTMQESSAGSGSDTAQISIWALAGVLLMTTGGMFFGRRRFGKI